MKEVTWTQSTAGSTRPPDAWWDALARAGWLPEQGRRVVVHVAAAVRSPIAVDTARALVGVLQRAGAGAVAVLDPGGNADAWPGVDRIDLGAGARLRVDAACLRDGAYIPELWLGDFSLVTVTGVAPNPHYGLSGILVAHTGLLDACPHDLGTVYEAHRLLAADLNVACGTREHGSPGSASWWAASTDDVALELAIAAAAGARADELPAIAYLARHEIVDAAAVTAPGDVSLTGYVAPAHEVRRARIGAEARRFGRMLREDISLAAANVHRIPQFIERRWPGVLPFGRSAA